MQAAHAYPPVTNTMRSLARWRGMTAEIRWVLFDADGVLQRMPADWQDRIEPLLGDEPFDTLVAIMAAESEAITGADFAGILKDVLRSRRVDSDPEELLAFWRMLEIDPEMLQRIASLRSRGLGCALATNQHHIRVAHMRGLPEYQDMFDAQFYSAEMGIAKPDPAYFTAIAERLQTPPAQLLFVDDRADNVAGARVVGLQAAEFAPHGSVGELDRILTHYQVADRSPG